MINYSNMLDVPYGKNFIVSASPDPKHLQVGAIVRRLSSDDPDFMVTENDSDGVCFRVSDDSFNFFNRLTWGYLSAQNLSEIPESESLVPEEYPI